MKFDEPKAILIAAIIGALATIVVAVPVLIPYFEDALNRGVLSPQTQTPDPHKLRYVEDIAGVFEFYYPDVFNGVARIAEAERYVYTVGDPDDPNSIGTMFILAAWLSDVSLPDDEWHKNAATLAIEVGHKGEYELLLLESRTLPGHSFYAEWQAKPKIDPPHSEYRIVLRSEEVNGILFMVGGMLRADAWPESGDELYLAIDQAKWSPDAARSVLEKTDK